MFTQEDRVVIKFLRQNKDYRTRHLAKEFPLKNGKNGLNVCQNEIHEVVAYVCEKVHQFLSSIKNMHTKENWFLFSASRCTSGHVFQTLHHSLSSTEIFSAESSLISSDVVYNP